MPLLNTEQLKALQERISTMDTEQKPTAEVSSSSPQTLPIPEEKPFVRETQEVRADQDDDEQEGHNVPYKRFKKVIESRNQLKGEIDYLKKEIEGLKSTRQTDRQFERSVDETNEEFDRALENILNPEASKVRSLEERMFAFEVAQEKVKLNDDLRKVRENYPDVPEQYVLQAILQDPSLDTMKVAEQYSLFFSQIEEQGIAKYLKKNGGQTQPTTSQKSVPAVPKRLTGTGGASTDQASSFGGVKKPQNLKTAHNAVLDFLRKNPFNT